MHHLKLVKGLSYWSRFVKADKEHPDVFVDGDAYLHAMASGYFEEAHETLQSAEPEGGDPASDTTTPEEEQTKDSFEGMTISDLKDYAHLNGISLSGAKKKDEILDMIRTAEVHAAQVRASFRD